MYPQIIKTANDKPTNSKGHLYLKNKVIGPNLVCYIILTFLWFFQLSFTRYGSFEQTEDSSLSKNHLPPLGADPALGRHDPGRPLQLLARADRLGPRQGPRQAQRVSGRGPIQFRNRWNFVSLLQCFKDLCKLNFLMMVWFHALANFQCCPSGLQKWYLFQKWSKSTQKWSSCLVDLNPWHTLHILFKIHKVVTYICNRRTHVI